MTELFCRKVVVFTLLMRFHVCFHHAVCEVCKDEEESASLKMVVLCVCVCVVSRVCLLCVSSTELIRVLL